MYKSRLNILEHISAEEREFILAKASEISAKSSVNNHYSNDFFFVEVKNNGIKKAIYSVNL